LLFEQDPGAENFSNLSGQSSFVNKNYVFLAIAEANNKGTATAIKEAIRTAMDDLKEDGARRLQESFASV